MIVDCTCACGRSFSSIAFYEGHLPCPAVHVARGAKQVFEGYVYETWGGRVAIDSCSSDAAHATAPADPEAGKRLCRHILEELFEPYVGRHGTLTVIVGFRESFVGSRAVFRVNGEVVGYVHGWSSGEPTQFVHYEPIKTVEEKKEK